MSRHAPVVVILAVAAALSIAAMLGGPRIGYGPGIVMSTVMVLVIVRRYDPPLRIQWLGALLLAAYHGGGTLMVGSDVLAHASAWGSVLRYDRGLHVFGAVDTVLLVAVIADRSRSFGSAPSRWGRRERLRCPVSGACRWPGRDVRTGIPSTIGDAHGSHGRPEELRMTVVSSEMIADLPDPVQRSLHRSGIVGSAVPEAVTVCQEGRIRTGPDARWLRFAAVEEYRLDPPGFDWNAALKIAGVTLGRATDSLRGGRGRMHVRLLGLFTAVDATGPELDQGTLMRWLNETMWFPAVWATDVISWESIDESSATGSISVGDLSVIGEFRFDDDGRLVDFRADRYRDVGSGFEMTPWSTPLTEHARFSGIELPSYGNAVWSLEDGDFEYIRIRVTDVRYSN